MTRRICFVALACLVGLTSIAVAEKGDTEVRLQVKPPDKSNPKTKNDAPSIEATVIRGQNLPVDKITLTETIPGKTPVTIKAEKKREYTEGTDTLAICLVLNGQETWVGNDEVPGIPDEEKYPGLLKNLISAIDQLKLGEAGPPGSKGCVVSYSTGASLKQPMVALNQITGASLGSQKDYYRKVGTDMVQGITEGVAQLQRVSTVRKALIVVGDGCDTNADAARPTLANLKRDALKQNIDLFAVIYKGPLSCDANVITAMIPSAKIVNSVDGVKSEMTFIIEQMKMRFYVTFPGYDPKIGAGFTWDGKEHGLVVKLDQTEMEEFPLVMAPKWDPPTSGGFPWLILVIVLVALLLLIIIGVKVFGKKEVPLPAPMPVVAAPVAEAPKPQGPLKTVMLSAGGGEDGFPIVGWLVPLNGPNAYQTFKLRSSGTKIGTAPPADLVINDGFMSTQHCQIGCSPQGFTLIDGGSTNGCYVNDRKVQKHDLVDNDMITLGKTNFKFKSIS
jgi:hypothetical protein